MRAISQFLCTILMLSLGSIPAVAACTQSELAGKWVFQFRAPLSDGVLLLVCPGSISKLGYLSAPACYQPRGEGKPGRLEWAGTPGQVVLRENCSVGLNVGSNTQLLIWYR